MATFEAAIPVLMEHEGGVSDIGDGEGVTAFGWTIYSCRMFGVDQPKTTEEAMELYNRFFWNSNYSQFRSQNVATKVFDDAVNQGPRTAHMTLQKALCSVGSIVVVDGSIGPMTIAASNVVDESMLLPWMRLMQYKTYDTYIRTDPEVREKFRNGLAKRAAWPDPDGSITKSLLNSTYTPISSGTIPGGINAPNTQS